MADTKRPTERPDEERRQMTDRERADQPVTERERQREERAPEHPGHPEPGKVPGLDGDVFGR